MIARRSYAYYEAAANILREENEGDMTYFLEYYLDNLPVLVDKPDGPHIMLRDCDISYFVKGANV